MLRHLILLSVFISLALGAVQILRKEDLNSYDVTIYTENGSTFIKAMSLDTGDTYGPTQIYQGFQSNAILENINGDLVFDRVEGDSVYIRPPMYADSSRLDNSYQSSEIKRSNLLERQIQDLRKELSGRIGDLEKDMSGTIAYFELDSCPRGWKDYTGLDGRVARSAGTYSGIALDGREETVTIAVGQTGGENENKLTVGTMPYHNHVDGTYVYALKSDCGWTVNIGTDDTCGEPNIQAMGQISGQGGDQPHNNWPPYLVLKACQKI